MPWDEAAFRARIMEKAKRLGMSERDVMRAAKIALNTFDKVVEKQGRTYNIIEQIAGAVGMTVAEAIGAEGAPSMPLLKHSVERAVRAVGDRTELLEDAIVSAYDVLSARVRQNLPVDDSALSTVEEMLRQRRPR